MNESTEVRRRCGLLAKTWIVLGSMGMVVSFFQFMSGSINNVTAGASGLVASVLLMGFGLTNITMLAVREPEGKKTD